MFDWRRNRRAWCGIALAIWNITVFWWGATASVTAFARANAWSYDLCESWPAGYASSFVKGNSLVCKDHMLLHLDACLTVFIYHELKSQASMRTEAQTSVFRIWPQVWKRNRTDFWIGDSNPRIHCQVCCRGYANACSFFVALSMLGQLLDLGEGRVTQQTLPVREANLKMRRKSENMCKAIIVID